MFNLFVKHARPSQSIIVLLIACRVLITLIAWIIKFITEHSLLYVFMYKGIISIMNQTTSIVNVL